VIPQSDLGVSEADEPHCTFVENALAKARHASQVTDLPALADDSGICVDALDGAPGVHSARFAGAPKSDARNNALLIEKLAGEAHRNAHYVCALVLVRSAEDPQPIIAEGEWHGQIIDTPRGQGGFGYDPYFWLPEMEQTAAELDATLKNTLSHRGAACRHLLAKLGQPNQA
jgi:XTP/dITP diphosphohydrolase